MARIKKIIKSVFSYLLLILIIGILYFRYFKIDTDQIRFKTIDLFAISETSYPENYDSLLVVDSISGNNYLLGLASYAKIVSNDFPFKRRLIDTATTGKLLKILNDSSTYQWGELGTPYHENILIFYDSSDNIVGYTNIDYGGELDSYPYRSVMKWGALTNKGYDRLIKILPDKY